MICCLTDHYGVKIRVQYGLVLHGLLCICIHTVYERIYCMYTYIMKTCLWVFVIEFYMTVLGNFYFSCPGL